MSDETVQPVQDNTPVATAPAPSPEPAPAPATLLQELSDDVRALLVKIENFEHEIAAGLKAKLEIIFNDIKERI